MLLFVDNLTNSDFCFLDPKRGLLGETWLSHITLEGELDSQGMVCDFGTVKAAVRQLLDESIDHCLLVPSRSPHVTIHQGKEKTDVRWRLENGKQIHHQSPPQCVTLIEAEVINAEIVSEWCEKELQRILPASLKAIDVSFSNEKIDSAYYHYGHGLKKHAGKCQRIAHGHRSKIEIWCNGERNLTLEADWANNYADSYIATRHDLFSSDDCPEDHYQFKYQAPEGEFFLQLPQEQCYLIDSDSTVENIASHIASTLNENFPQNTYVVKAYEGISKGAIASC